MGAALLGPGQVISSIRRESLISARGWKLLRAGSRSARWRCLNQAGTNWKAGMDNTPTFSRYRWGTRTTSGVNMNVWLSRYRLLPKYLKISWQLLLCFILPFACSISVMIQKTLAKRKHSYRHSFPLWSENSSRPLFTWPLKACRPSQSRIMQKLKTCTST